MPQTRAQKAGAMGASQEDKQNIEDQQDLYQKSSKTNSLKGSKRKTPLPEPSSAEPATKVSKPPSDSSSNKPSQAASDSKITKLLELAPSHSLPTLKLEDPESPTRETLLAHLLHALLASARISHKLALRSTETLIAHKYHYLRTLAQSTWEQRTAVLTEGGYTRYREKTATGLGELVGFLKSNYEGDLNNLLKASKGVKADVKKRLKEIKGLGDMGVGLFFDTAQGLWPELAPYIDGRNEAEVEKLGLGSTEEVWEEVGRDTKVMARVVAALSEVRLEGKEEEVEDARDGNGSDGAGE